MKIFGYITLLLSLGLFLNPGRSYAQIVSGNAYLIGDYLEIAVHGEGGHEGTADWPGHHSRGGSPDVPFGFVANPTLDGWIDYDGDFFTAGTPENGFGLEINGVNYSNNAWDASTSTPFLNEIPTAPGGEITHTIDGDCIIVEWNGIVAGVAIKVLYRLKQYSLFYTTEITLTNTTGSTLNDLYYYRNVDPDNNESIGGTFNTTNEIVSQTSPECIKAFVSATQAIPWDSYVGIGALGNKFKVSHGGFSNRDASDIWNGTGGLTGVEGDVSTGDEAISLAYKTDLAAGASETFSYVVVLSHSTVDLAIASLFHIDFESMDGIGGGAISECNPETVVVNTCRGDSVMLTIQGPFTDHYDWVWSPYDEAGDTIYVTPDEEGLISAIGTPIDECLFISPFSQIHKMVLVEFTYGPKIDIIYPTDTTLICGEFNMADLVYENIGDPATNCVLLTEQPDSATQTEPAFTEPTMDMFDEVWLMCGDSITGCFDFVKLEFNFLGDNAAGEDDSLSMCGGPGLTIDISLLLSDSANVFGTFVDVDGVGGLHDSTGLWNASNQYGVFTFYYVTPGVDTCEADTAVFIIELTVSPAALFEYEINGVSSTEGVSSACLGADVDFINMSYIADPGEIVYWVWYFGDGDSSNVENPSHTYDEIGTYTVTLVVLSDNGCRHAYAQTIVIYDKPEIEYIYTEPVCHGSMDGFIDVEDTFIGNPLTVTVTDEDGNIVNEDGGPIADSLGPGMYYIYIEDPGGCFNLDSIMLYQPPPMDIFYRLQNPPCNGDSGYVVIDSVIGENPNNPVEYFWEPNPAGIEGVTADSSYWMQAGDYTVTAIDSKGCNNSIDFTLVDPPHFYFTEWGWDTAYCRMHGYQSGNGVVYAAAAGGVPNYVYEWTYLVDGSTSNNTTWGGRNPGDHLITVTDSFGCQLTKVIYVDSVNPIAAFDIISTDLNEYLQGTAEVAVEYVNRSKYFANPNDPDADTLFHWDMDRTDEDDWIISYDYFERFDTIYGERGHSYEIEVCLIAYNKNTCRDTACQKLIIWQPPELSTVNIFSPNGDGDNDVLTFKNHQKGIDEFHCIIVNRWGVQVGEINRIAESWDGRDYDGQYCTDGVYFYTYIAIADNTEKFSGQGTVTIIDSPRKE